MGRKSDYTKKPQDQEYSKYDESTYRLQKEKELADIAKDKLRQEPITVKELSAYLSNNSINNKSFSEKIIKLRIEEICKLSDGLIDKSVFRENPNNEKSKFLFPPEIQGVLLTILDTSFFDGRKNGRSLVSREAFYDELLENIENYPRDCDKTVIKRNPAILTISQEKNFIYSITASFQNIISEALNSNEMIRFHLLNKIDDTFKDLEKSIISDINKFITNEYVFLNSFDEHERAEYYNKIFSPDYIMDYLISYLSYIIDTEVKKTIEPDRNAFDYLSVCNVVDNISELQYFFESKELTKKIKEIKDSKCNNRAKNNVERLDRLIKKAEDVFDKNNEDELIMFNAIKGLASMWWIRPEMTDNDFEKIKSLFQKCMGCSLNDFFIRFFNYDDEEDYPEPNERMRRRMDGYIKESIEHLSDMDDVLKK